MPISVAAVGLSEPDERLLAATLAALSIRTDKVWKQAGGASAEILVVDLRGTEGAAAFAQRGSSPGKVFIALAPAGIVPTGIELTSVESTSKRTVLPLRAPLQAAELSGALESAEKVLADLRAGLPTVTGTLLPRLDPAATYRLTHWPTMEMLGAQPALLPSLLKVAAYLIKRVGTLQEVAARTGLAPETVADVFNAYALTGYLEVVPREHVVEQPAPTRVNQAATPAKRGLFQRIRAKLGLAS